MRPVLLEEQLDGAADSLLGGGDNTDRSCVAKQRLESSRRKKLRIPLAAPMPRERDDTLVRNVAAIE